MRSRQLAAFGGLIALYGSTYAQDKPASPTSSNPAPASAATPEAPVKTLPGDATEPDPVAILKKADTACRSIKAVRYFLKTERPGTTGAQRNRMECEALLTGWKEGQPERYRYDVRTFPSGKDEPKDIVIGYDGETYYVIDKQGKQAFVGTDQVTLGIYRIILRFVPIYEFVRPHPFEDEIASNKIEYRGGAKVGDEECETVFVAYASGGGEALWYFSKKDYLPRQLDRKLRSPEGATIDQRWILSNVKPDPKLDDEAFKLKLPDGFTRIDGPVR